MPKKPEPLVIDGHYRYTLSSYEPVSITVTVPHLTDDEVAYGVAGVLAESGLADGETASDAWVREHVSGVSSIDELRQAVRAQLEALNSRYADASKPALCAEQLAARLEQDVPASAVAEVRATLMDDLKAQVGQAGISLDDALAGMGVPAGTLESMLDGQARVESEKDAALDAMADKLGITVDETELPGLLGLSPKATQELVAQARAHGGLDPVLRHARRKKASDSVVGACSCTYRRESAEEAERRVRMAQERRAGWTMPGEAAPQKPDRPEPAQDGPRPDSRSHLKLV